jgi:hypothetical protein
MLDNDKHWNPPMRSAFILALVCLCSFLASTACAQDGPSPHGKTDTEILAMGQPAWIEFYTNEVDGSNAGLGRANTLYAGAMRRRNDARPQFEDAAELRDLLNAFGQISVDIASNAHGLGTFWGPRYCEMACDVEGVLYGLLGGEMPPVEPAMTGLVERDLAWLAKQIKTAVTKPDTPLANYGLALSDLDAQRKAWRKIKRLAAKLDRTGSDRVLRFCDTWANSITLMNEGF